MRLIYKRKELQGLYITKPLQRQPCFIVNILVAALMVCMSESRQPLKFTDDGYFIPFVKILVAALMVLLKILRQGITIYVTDIRSLESEILYNLVCPYVARSVCL